VTGPDANGLIKTGAGTSFDSGAASLQTITHGDAYVEFTATETNKARVGGLASSALPDTDPGLDDISFGIRLSATGGVFVSESGTLVTGAGGTPFSAYAPGDRLRVTVLDRLDGTADVRYALVPAGCAGASCETMTFRTAGPAPYPFRVDASLKEPGATLTDVRIVRIK